MTFLVSRGWKGEDFAKFWGGAGFTRENKKGNGKGMGVVHLFI
jgi:hypothetical protein